jgi:hypothetical protein
VSRMAQTEPPGLSSGAELSSAAAVWRAGLRIGSGNRGKVAGLSELEIRSDEKRALSAQAHRF